MFYVCSCWGKCKWSPRSFLSCGSLPLSLVSFIRSCFAAGQRRWQSCGGRRGRAGRAVGGQSAGTGRHRRQNSGAARRQDLAETVSGRVHHLQRALLDRLHSAVLAGRRQGLTAADGRPVLYRLTTGLRRLPTASSIVHWTSPYAADARRATDLDAADVGVGVELPPCAADIQPSLKRRCCFVARKSALDPTPRCTRVTVDKCAVTSDTTKSNPLRCTESNNPPVEGQRYEYTSFDGGGVRSVRCSVSSWSFRPYSYHWSRTRKRVTVVIPNE